MATAMGGQADGLETAAAGDRREQRRDEGHRDPHADGNEQIQREVARDRTAMRGWGT